MFVQQYWRTPATKMTYYEVLGISRNATCNEIREAYLKMSKKFHPDINRHDTESDKKFVEISKAYSVLSKPCSRHEYNMSLISEQCSSSHVVGIRRWPHDLSRKNGFHDGTASYSQSNNARGNNQGQKTSIYDMVTSVYSLATVLTVAFLVLLWNLDSGVNTAGFNNNSSNIEYYRKEDLEKEKLLWKTEQYGMVIFFFDKNFGTNKREVIVACREVDDKTSDYRYRVLTSYKK